MKIGFSFEALVKKVLKIEDSQLVKENNLSDLLNVDVAVSNLGLGSSAKKDAGTNQENVLEVSKGGIGGYTITNQTENAEFPDPNKINRNGFFFYPSNTENLPDGGGWFIISFVNASSVDQPDTGTKCQLAIKQGESASEGIYTRGQNNSSSVWSSWTLIS